MCAAWVGDLPGHQQKSSYTTGHHYCLIVKWILSALMSQHKNGCVSVGLLYICMDDCRGKIFSNYISVKKEHVLVIFGLIYYILSIT